MSADHVFNNFNHYAVTDNIIRHAINQIKRYCQAQLQAPVKAQTGAENSLLLINQATHPTRESIIQSQIESTLTSNAKMLDSMVRP